MLILVCLLCVLIFSIQQELIGLTTFPSSVFRNLTGVVCVNDGIYSINVKFDLLFSGCLIILTLFFVLIFDWLLSLTQDKLYFIGTNPL